MFESTWYNKIDKNDEHIMQIAQDLKQIGHVAIVTGGNHGIGYEICKELSMSGCLVVLTSRNEEGKKVLR